MKETVFDFRFDESLPCSAIVISLRPMSAFLIFLTQKSANPLDVFCSFSLGEESSSELSLHTEAQQIQFFVFKQPEY